MKTRFNDGQVEVDFGAGFVVVEVMRVKTPGRVSFAERELLILGDEGGLRLGRPRGGERDQRVSFTESAVEERFGGAEFSRTGERSNGFGRTSRVKVGFAAKI